MHAIAGNGGSLPTASPSTQRRQLLGSDSTSRDTDEQLAPADEKCNDIIARQNPSTKDYVPFESTGISHSAAMSQLAIIPEDVGVDEKVMPR
jgi:hypothetical protein